MSGLANPKEVERVQAAGWERENNSWEWEREIGQGCDWVEEWTDRETKGRGWPSSVTKGVTKERLSNWYKHQWPFATYGVIR